MNRPLLALPAAVVFALAGCGGSDDAAEPEADASTATTEAAETESPSASPSPSPTEEPLPEAADGTDYDACFDGSCEVLVSEPVDIALDPELDTQATTASVTEFSGWTFGVEFSSNGQTMGSVTWLDMRENGPGPVFTTYDGASIDMVAFVEGEVVIAISVPE